MATAVRGTINDNPWASVNPGEDPHDHNNNNRNPPRLLVLQEGLVLQVLDLVIQIFLCLDAALGLLTLIFGTLLRHRHAGESGMAVAWLGTAGILLLARSAAVGLGLFLPPDLSCRRVGLHVAAGLSAALAVFWTVTAVTALAAPQTVQTYLHQHPLDLTQAQLAYILHHYTALVIIIIIGAVVEGIKFPVYRVYRRSLLFLEDEEERAEEQHLIRREAATGRPWWWNSPSMHNRRRPAGSAALTEALLEDGENEAHETTRRRRRRFLLWPFGRHDHHDPRDDASVDFASVQSEWASRAEEDPVWWSREDADVENIRTPPRGNTNNNQEDVDTSWAHDVSQV